MGVRVAAIILCVLCSLPRGHGFSSGAPESRCESMRPDHGYRASYRSGPTRYYAINVAGNKTYAAGQSLEVEILASQSRTFKGFTLQARKTSGEKESYGTFTPNPAYVTKTACDKGALTHDSSSRKDNILTTWTAPEETVGDIVFVATVVESFRTVYLGIKSDVIQEAKVVPSSGPCSEEQLEPLPAQRPHVAMLCSDDVQCPCSWRCCAVGCNSGTCDAAEQTLGHAICRQPHINATALNGTMSEE